MSRMGNRAIDLPDDVELTLDNDTVIAEGSEGTLQQDLAQGIDIEINDDHVVLTRGRDTKQQKSQHGLMRSLIENIIHGVSEGFTKTLILNGLGYRAQHRGDTITLELGYSNPVDIEVPDQVDVDVPNETTIKVSGIDKQVVGDFAAKIRHLREPDPYNQKGVKYEDEHIRQKVGKAVGGDMEGAEGAEA